MEKTFYKTSISDDACGVGWIYENSKLNKFQKKNI